MNDPKKPNPYQPPPGELQRPEERPDLYAIVSDVAAATSYSPEAYLFVLQGLEFAKQHVRHARQGGHIDAVDLCWCVHDLAMHRFGDTARLQLENWNLKTTRDFGEVVYSLVEAGLMRAGDDDLIEDFDNVFEFADQFRLEDFKSTIVDDSP